MLLVPAAFAIEPGLAFDCPELEEPADGWRYADPGPISAVVQATLADWIRGRYDAGCPAAACEGIGEATCVYADDCVTGAGEHIVVDYRYESDDWSYTEESWDAVVETVDGGRVTLVSTKAYYWVWNPGYVRDDRTLDATWTVPVDARMPASGQVTATTDFDGNYGDSGPQSGRDEEVLDSGACSWDILRSSSGYYACSEMETTRTITVGGHTLVVHPWGGPMFCDVDKVRWAELDDERFRVAFDTWELTEDVDGDGVPFPDDCDDGNPERTPCADEDVACDGIDQDCSGADRCDDEDTPSPGTGCGGVAMVLLPIALSRRSRRPAAT